MVKIPTATRPSEPAHPAGPPLPPSPDAVAGDSRSADAVVQQGAEDGETVSVIVPAGVTDHALTGVETDVAAPTLDVATSVTRTPTEDETPLEAPGSTAGASPAPPVDDRQPFKVVLRLKPVKGNRWHATIGIGRDGCDPCWEGSDVDDWPEALDAVLGLHAAAEARWVEQPRNPRPAATPTAPGSLAATGAPPRPSAKTAGKAGNARAAGNSNAAPLPTTPAAASASPPAAPAPPVPAADPAPAGGVEKLTLF